MTSFTPENRGALKHRIMWAAYEARLAGTPGRDVFNRIVELQLSLMGTEETRLEAWLDGLSAGVLAGKGWDA